MPWICFKILLEKEKETGTETERAETDETRLGKYY